MHCELPPLTPDGRRPQALRGRRQVSRCLQLVTWGSPAGSFSFPESAARLQDQLIVVRQGRSGSKGQHPQAADDGLCSRPIGRLRLEAPLCAGLRTSQTSAAGAGHSPGDAVAVALCHLAGRVECPQHSCRRPSRPFCDFQSSRTFHGSCTIRFLSLDGHTVEGGGCLYLELAGPAEMSVDVLGLVDWEEAGRVVSTPPGPPAWEGEAVSVGRGQGQAHWAGRLACLAGRSEGRGAGWE